MVRARFTIYLNGPVLCSDYLSFLASSSLRYNTVHTNVGVFFRKAVWKRMLGHTL